VKELIERLRNDCYQEDEVRAHAKEAAAALERMEAESQPAALEASTADSVHQINMRRATNRFEQLMIENKNLRRNLTFWRDSYSLLSRTAHAAERGIERDADEFIRMSGDIERLTAERDVEKEHVRQRALLVRARNLLSQPAHWGADDEHIKSRYALYTEISEHIAGEKK
jgi:hypothetical protein